MASGLNQDLIRALRREIDEFVEREEAHFEENLLDYSDSAFEDQAAEVLRTFESNYSSRQIGIMQHDDLDGGEILQLLRGAGLNDKAIVGMIVEHSAAQTCDYYVQWNEVASVQVGEMEYQIDVADASAELQALVAAATDAELHAAGAKRDRFCAYGHPCDRIIWKLDPVSFLEAVAAAVGTARARSQA